MKKIKYSEITPEKIYKNRRSFIKSIGLSAGSIAMTSFSFVNNALGKEEKKLTSYKDITTYNNYYEFGTSKSDPYKNSQNFKTKPWNKY
jgi:sulfoxide reductase catalytic subunit YedY